jgi:hypothetical protein
VRVRPKLTALAALLAGAAVRADDIRDIRGPKAIFPLGLALLVAAGLVALVLAAIWLWRRLHRPKPVVLTPAEIALKRIEEARLLMSPTTVREFSTAISDVVRGYIEVQFDVTATHLTTEEFLQGALASSSKALSAHRDLLARFLEECDMAKFAKASLSAPIMEELYQSAREFVIETARSASAADTPRPAPTPAPP